jgi:hypothetical protein
VSNKAILAAAAVVLLVAAAIAVRSGKEPSAQLRALQADPMAEYAPAGAALVDTDEQNEGTTFGKPVAARSVRLFAVSGASPERVLADALAAAEAAGWTLEQPQRSALGGLVAQGSKRLPTGTARLGLTIFLDATVLPDDARPPALRVSLEHLSP